MKNDYKLPDWCVRGSTHVINQTMRFFLNLNLEHGAENRLQLGHICYRWDSSLIRRAPHRSIYVPSFLLFISHKLNLFIR